MVEPKLWPAPAKLNLFLHVVGRRADGYHLLQTIFQFLDYGDELSFSLNQSGNVTRAYHADFSEADDLCLRAARLLQPLATNGSGVEINLLKRLPQGGGLGGGSSDAATVLLALNHLWGIGLPRPKLAELGLRLGADVPVFVMGYAAWAEGVGEQLTPIELAEPWYVILAPEVMVSTKEIFSNKNLTPRGRMKKIRALESSAQIQFGENQLQAIAVDTYPQIGACLDWLSQFALARMTGSGGCVFAAVASKAQAQAIIDQKPANTSGFIAKGLNIHPLYELS